jgi:CubicO group peptidase (beta-lactamase class C family)
MHSGGGGLVATADDYLKFCEMLRQRGLGPRGRLLQERTVQAMLTNELRSDQGPLFWHQKQPSPLMRGGGWGLGIGVRTADVDEDPLVSHRGEAFWGGLAGTGFLVDPASGTSAVVMSQYYGREGDDVSFILRRGVYGSP